MATATKKIAVNTGVQLVGKIIILIVAGLSVAFTTRYLGVEAYGSFTLALVYLSFYGLAADLGLFTISLREISRHPERAKEIIGNTLGLRIVLSAIMMVLAVGIGFLLPYDHQIQLAIAVGSVSVFFGLLNSAIVAFFQARLMMHLSVLADVIGRTAAFAAVLLVITQDWGFLAIVATAAVGTGITLILSTIFARKYVSLAVYKDIRVWKEMLRESIPLGAALFVATLYFKADLMLLSFMRSPAEVGIYSAVFKVVDLLMTFPGFFVNSVFPVLIARLKQSPEDGLRVMQKSTTALAVLGLGLAFGGLVLAEDIMRIIGGPDFVAGADALRISLCALAFNFVMSLFATFYIAKDKQVDALKLATFGLVLNISINLYLIPHYGIIGASIATLICEAVLLLLYTRGVNRMLVRPIDWRPVAKICVAGALMVAVMWPIRDHFFLAFPLGGLTYLAGIWGLRVLGRDVMKELRP
jgi:O-antigen/teichoic acid export membrane protein